MVHITIKYLCYMIQTADIYIYRYVDAFILNSVKIMIFNIYNSMFLL